MMLLGDRNWWAPGWLRRLHTRIGLREHVDVRMPDTGRTDAAQVSP